jgi:YggT family protein
MIALISLILSLFTLVLFVRAILSWFPNKRGAVADISDVTVAITEPVLAPVRRRLPPMGGFDLSFLVVFVGVYLIQLLLRG